jgi:hypothetical protein
MKVPPPLDMTDRNPFLRREDTLRFTVEYDRWGRYALWMYSQVKGVSVLLDDTQRKWTC